MASTISNNRSTPSIVGLQGLGDAELYETLISIHDQQCLMLVLFQRKIIYMGYMPPGARTDRLRDTPERHLRGIICEEIQIKSDRNISLSGILVNRDAATNPSETSPETVLMYLQGNAGNPLHRLPIFQSLLQQTPSLAISILAFAPRSFWTSSNRTPTQRGILADYAHALQYAQCRFPEACIVLYGHSLGGSVAVCLLAQLPDGERGKYKNIKGLILENPFTSIPNMVRALYPEKWVPYHHLAPLAWDKWDAVRVMRESRTNGSVLGRISQGMMVLVSEKDEVVPRDMGRMLWDQRREEDGGCVGRLIQINGALHENAWQKRQWASEVSRYLKALRAR